MNLENPDNLNPYQPPSSALSPPPLPSQTASLFYVVSKKKFFVLFVATFSFYSVYWFWKQWSKWREATGEKIWPVARTLFFIFFTHSLFSKIESDANKVSGSQHKKLSIAATVFIIAEIAFNYMDAYPLDDIFYTALTMVLVGILSISMWQAQAQANIASLDSEGLENSRFTIANYIWIVLGCVFWLLVIIGIFTPDIA